MRFEILAKRIAEKANFPGLEDALLGQGDLPEKPCMLWTGRKTQGGLQRKMVRGSDNRPQMLPVMQSSFPLIQFEKRVQYLHRLVYSKTQHSVEGFRLSNLCGDTLCINPHHWAARRTSPEDPEPEAVVEMDPLDEITEWLEDFLTRNSTITHQDIEENDIPEALLYEALMRMNKEHLIP